MSINRKISSALLWPLALIAPLAVATAEERLNKVIDLGEGSELRIMDNADMSLTVTIMSQGVLSESYTVGNASVDESTISKQKFCADCMPAYFIPAYDRSSTYGATTGVVVWGDGWWQLAILPMDRPVVEDINGDGISEIVDYQVVDQKETKTAYRFDNGFLVKVK